VTALIGGQVTAGISGYSEFAQHIESGRLRAIGISAPGRVAGLDVPTLVEQGLDVELANWRAVMAPPGLSVGQRQTLIAVVERMAQSDSWRATLKRLGWTDSFLAGPAFDRFLDAERVRIGRIVARLRGPAGDSTSARTGEWLFPVLVIGSCLAVLTRLFVGRGAATAGAPQAYSAPVVRVAIGLVFFVALLNLLGFIAAGAVLFVSTASAFGSQRRLRDAFLGIALCAAVHIIFTYGLGVPLPSGPFPTER
jgi:hypothetical protein